MESPQMEDNIKRVMEQIGVQRRLLATTNHDKDQQVEVLEQQTAEAHQSMANISSHSRVPSPTWRRRQVRS
ncbi:hypothetical protein PsorP6_007156 [Peronosclerospora sorghi]|uniref:Uncharacterized protein n=1 Tax=Peronosclerospora sorghi TaxID=230839 RepID=A0ACC0W9C7_9STRA|nr:hypothetical protein PsorP6_007156 [Peronosclerospora sorghi]